jgi:hypothetical protein
MLFNIVVEMLAILIARAKDDGQVSELMPHLVEGGVSILQCANDTILFMEYNLPKAVNMKLILCIFTGVRYFVFEKPGVRRISKKKYLVVRLDHYHSNI